MSEPIKVGDLVVIARPTPCCGNEGNVGIVFVVSGIDYGGSCSYCSRPHPRAAGAFGKSDGHMTQVSRLKRIPPLKELDDVKRDEEIHA